MYFIASLRVYVCDYDRASVSGLLRPFLSFGFYPLNLHSFIHSFIHHPFYFYIKFKRYYSVRARRRSTMLHVLDTSTIRERLLGLFRTRNVRVQWSDVLVTESRVSILCAHAGWRLATLVGHQSTVPIISFWGFN